MAASVAEPEIDPATGERIKAAGGVASMGASASPTIDPETGERTKPGAALTSAAETPSKLGTFGANVAKGLGESAVGLMSTGDEFARKHLPAFLTNSNLGFGKPADLSHVKDLATPANTTQAVTKGIGDAAQFMIPGAAEDKLALQVPEALRGAAKVGASALGAGSVNKAQGGSFGTGALIGGAGSGIGQGLKAAAPIVAETALGIPKAARAFGKTPGAAILNETSGVRPGTIAASAREAMSKITPQLEQAADAASVRPNPVRGLLPAPAKEIPLETGAYAGATPTSQAMPNDVMTRYRQPIQGGRLIDAKVNPEESMEPRSGNQFAPISDYPAINPHYLSGSAHPEMSGRFGPSKGVLIRPFEAPNTSPLPRIVPNATASLGPARGVLSDAASKASSQNAAGLHGQIGNMQDFLGRRFDSGAQIPENVTPRQLLDLKRGFSEEHLRWNPELHDAAVATGRRAYGALDSELDRTVPEAAGLNQRLSSLIPVAQRAESISRGAPTIQRALGRFGAHTGALTLGGVGAGAGYKEGGLPGAIAGGVTGVLAPELVASPEGQMVIARSLNKAQALKPIVGAALQADRKKAQ